MQLSPHFTLEEFSKDGPIPSNCFDIFEEFCDLVLEPVREYLGRPMTITSGYRPPDINQKIHGVSNSEHVATPSYCAADFVFDINEPTILTYRMCFDWVRGNPELPFHQVILENDPKGGSIIHISYNLAKAGQRQALQGATYNQSAYTSFDVVPFAPTTGEVEA